VISHKCHRALVFRAMRKVLETRNMDLAQAVGDMIALRAEAAKYEMWVSYVRARVRPPESDEPPAKH
jgi:hypothetical protein